MTEKEKIYEAARRCYGTETQMIVAIEELSECQKELCKLLRDDGNILHLAEEIADAQIMLEQMVMFYEIDDLVADYRATKVLRLKLRIEETRK